MSDTSDIDNKRAERVIEEIGVGDYYVGWVRAEEIVLKLIATIRAEERASHEDVIVYVDELTGGLSAEAEAKLRALLRGK